MRAAAPLPSLPANASESWDFLTFFKPTNFIDNADANVLERRDDYRGPDPLIISVGTGWNENPRDADFFNESEAAYTLNFDMANGLTFDMDGSATTRHSPFFKIRRWRSLHDPSGVTLEGAPLANDASYRADVKPIARAEFANALSWHSTLENAGAVTSPDVGGGGGISGTTTFTSARYGQGLPSTRTATTCRRTPRASTLRSERSTSGTSRATPIPTD